MQVKKQQLELGMAQQTGSKLGKEYIKAVYCHPPYLTICRVQDEAQAGIKIARRNINKITCSYSLDRAWWTLDDLSKGECFYY